MRKSIKKRLNRTIRNVSFIFVFLIVIFKYGSFFDGNPEKDLSWYQLLTGMKIILPAMVGFGVILFLLSFLEKRFDDE